jgi:adenylate cyclase
VTNIHKISRLALGGERREVTCLFVEVRPLAAFKKEAPRDVMEMLNRYLSVATSAIYQMQGVIDKYMGNEVMALFNTQLNPQTNHAQLCIECALKMRDGFAALYQELGITPAPHDYRVGLHTGICTLGNVGSLTRRDFTAIGDSINLAKRVEENSAYGQIVITEATYQHLQANVVGSLPLPYRFESRPPIQAKGKTTATSIYEVFRA